MSEIKTILLVEDSPHDVEMILAALAEHRLLNDVVVLSDGAEALDYLYFRGKYKLRASSAPAVILLDLKMPKVDGLEVLRIIKSDPGLKMLPVVMLTSSREEQDLIKSYQLGANGYVVKPVGFPEFVDAMKQLGAFWVVRNEPPPGQAVRYGHPPDLL